MVFISVMAGSQTTGFSMPSVVGTALALGVLFLAVLIHELGHAWVARRMDVEVVAITLWPLGGMAMMRNMPEDPRVEMRIAAAGPLINLAVGGAAALLWALLQGPTGGSFDWESVRVTQVHDFSGFLLFTAICHLMLGAFNLLPAFPMDGGKILRSALARRRDWLPATESAVRVGRWLAWAMVLAGFVYGEWALMLIAVYLLLSGTKELWVTRLRHANPLAEAWQAASGGAPPPQDSPWNEAEEPTPGESHSGFSEEDIRRMEAQKGSLRSDRE